MLSEQLDWQKTDGLMPVIVQHGVLRRNPRFFRPFKLSTVEQLDPVRPQLTNRGNMPVQSLPGYPKFLA